MIWTKSTLQVFRRRKKRGVSFLASPLGLQCPP
jgi:hypothetical protein